MFSLDVQASHLGYCQPRHTMERAAVSISDLTTSCISKFETLLATPRDERLAEVLECRLADFNLWADGVGALAPSGASLDSRLKNRSNDVELVKNVLIMLMDSLGYYESLTANDPNNSGAVENIDSAIKNLAMIGVAIRRTGKASRQRRADKTFSQDDYPEFKKHLECIVLLRPTGKGLFHRTEDGSHIADLDASRLSGLQRRLIEANLRRRHNFVLAQKRSGTQEAKLVLHSIATVTSSRGDSQPEGTAKLEQNLEHFRSSTPGSLGTAKRDGGAPTISETLRASTAEGTLKYAPGKGRQVPGDARTVTLVVSRDEFPLPPYIPPGQEISKCPCCCQSLPVEILKTRKLWM